MSTTNDIDIAHIFTELAKTGDRLNGIPLPNIPMPTMGGHVFWKDIASENGWRLQKNMFTNHCRILDPDDVRRAWGSESDMKKLLGDLAK